MNLPTRKRDREQITPKIPKWFFDFSRWWSQCVCRTKKSITAKKHDINIKRK
jgi:hypothetical protein